MTGIPKKIHLIYFNQPVPDDYMGYMERMQTFNPAWNITIYGREHARHIIEDKMPGLIHIYDGLELDVQRTDILRLLLVYLFGGFYMDFDMFCLKNMDELCEHQLVLGEERTFTEAECEVRNTPHQLRIANYMFGGVKGHPFLLKLMEEAVRRSYGKKVRQEEDVLSGTGPGLVTDLYHLYKDRYPDMIVLYNRHRECLQQCECISCHFGDYAAHLHQGRWRWQLEGGEAVPARTFRE